MNPFRSALLLVLACAVLASCSSIKRAYFHCADEDTGVWHGWAYAKECVALRDAEMRRQ